MRTCLFALLLLSFLLNAQQGVPPEEEFITSRNEGWYDISHDKEITTEEFLSSYLYKLGLGDDDELIVLRRDTDKIGFVHTRMLQHYKHVPVEAAQLIFHERDGRLKSVNGKPVKGLDLSVIPVLTEKEATAKALEHVNAEEYIWGDDREHRFYPKPELIIAQEDFNQKAGDYKLTYKVRVYSTRPLARDAIYIDAVSGEYLFKISEIYNTDVPGTAHTKYSGVRPFITDSMGPSLYRLRSYGTLNEIQTYNLKNEYGYNTSFTDFIDSNNIWNNINPEQDEVATDVHWGSQVTMDYFFQRHRFYVNDGRPIVNFVHFGKREPTAFYNGYAFFYGDGDSVTTGPFTAMDVVGHELTHSITRATANLIYEEESGALNESFSDIFGVALKFYSDTNWTDYVVGKEIYLNGKVRRSMEDPNVAGDPDTYLGDHWYSGDNNNELVHTNSGVQNHWFYLLSEGGIGMNDNGYNYDVIGIGRENAEDIAFRNLVYYLTPSSDFHDAFVGSTYAAEDIFGTCSEELYEVAKAWKAVGVGSIPSNGDVSLLKVLSPALSCATDSNKNLSILIRNFGCNYIIRQGDSIEVKYELEGSDSGVLNYVFDSDLAPGDSMVISWNDVFDLSNDSSYSLQISVDYRNDINSENDTLKGRIVNRWMHQNNDIELTKIYPNYNSCGLSRRKNVVFYVTYKGCDSLAEGEKIPVTLKTENRNAINYYRDTIVLPVTLYKDQEYQYSFDGHVRDYFNGYYGVPEDVYSVLSAWIDHHRDEYAGNDTVRYPLYSPHSISKNSLLNFENTTSSMDSLFMRNPYYTVSSDFTSEVKIENEVGTNNSGAIHFTGENSWEKVKEVAFAKEDVLSNSPSVCFCVNAFRWLDDTLYLEFDLRQTSSLYWEKYGNIEEQSSSRFWITTSGAFYPQGGIYIPRTPSDDAFRHYKVKITDFINGVFQVCLNAENYISSAIDTVEGSLGDNVYLDNIILHDGSYKINLPEPSFKHVLNVYPNPAEGVFWLEVNSKDDVSAKFNLYDSRGRIVHSFSHRFTTGTNKLELDYSHVSEGIYFLQVSLKDNVLTKKIIIE